MNTFNLSPGDLIAFPSYPGSRDVIEATVTVPFMGGVNVILPNGEKRAISVDESVRVVKRAEAAQSAENSPMPAKTPKESSEGEKTRFRPVSGDSDGVNAGNDSEPAPKTYQLREIRDLLQIPPDRLGICLDELKQLLLMVHGCGDFVRAVAEDHGVEVAAASPVELPEVIEWTDDGHGELTVNVLNPIDPHETLFVATTQAQESTP